MDKVSFYNGQLFDSYRYMGSIKAKKGYQFVTYAPNAKKIALVGDFNDWKEQWMQPDEGFFCLTINSAKAGQLYKYRIYHTDTEWVEHTDPYAFQMELRPGCCAVITDLTSYTFHDNEWMEKRTVCYDQPLNIYEMHIGSWKTKPDDNGWYRYDELADLLVPYLKENHYTHVEFMPLMEHPFDGSWGYQTTGFFAPTSRYGEPHHLMELVDKLHLAGIGAIMDIVPVHFAVDSYGLRNYDGTALYEYPHGDVTVSEWGSCNFIYSRREVQCFMQSAANFWLKEYHFDGLRMDAVSRMIYWQGDEKRGINPNSFDFLKQMNAGLKQLHPTAMLIAEDSSAYEGVTKPVKDGGLGFDYKWALGWMHDTLEYFQTAPEYRISEHNKLTFAMSYFHTERFMLEFSHDENVHGKATVLQKMNGQYDDKFTQGKALYLFMMMHPGKKLNFMGGEIGQLREWDESRAQDWNILKYPNHDAFHQYIIELNRIHTSTPALHRDFESGNFQWLDDRQNTDCMFTMARLSENEGIAAIFNFSDRAAETHTVHFPNVKNMQMLLNTDWQMYGGQSEKTETLFAMTTVNNGKTITVSVPAFSGILFGFDMDAERKT